MVAVLQPWRVPDSIFAHFKAGQPSAVSKYFGTAVFSITNIIFITQSLSTLDSTFTSAAKLMGPEFIGVATCKLYPYGQVHSCLKKCVF